MSAFRSAAARLLAAPAVFSISMGAAAGSPRTFDEDVAFLKQHADVIVLGDEGEERVAVVPKFQGRVMTSTTGGADGLSHGWINYDLIASGKLLPHINPFGGEDRFWLGPEGGQFAIFFKAGDAFDVEHWQTPDVIDSVAYEVVSRDDDKVVFRHEAELTNFSGTTFKLRIDRTIRLLDDDDCEKLLGVHDLPDVAMVAYESENTITNTGDKPWTKDGGLLSIWILGMLRHSPSTTVVAPFLAGPESELGPIVNDSYFGKVPADRLKLGENVLFFKGDGQLRSKIGLSPRRARGVVGSYDPARSLMTIVQYNQPEGVTDYVNSMWEMQRDPYGGDAVNSYNDGPLAPGKPPLGPFYELETSSPAAALKPGESLTHFSRTMHFRGDGAKLDAIAKPVLGVPTAEIAAALK